MAAYISNPPDVLRQLNAWLENPLVRPAEAARLCGVSRVRMYQLIHAGRVSPLIVDCQQMVSVRDLVALYASRQAKSALAGKSQSSGVKTTKAKSLLLSKKGCPLIQVKS